MTPLKRTKTIETYILPEEFDYYTKSGYVIFLAQPTVFGTFKAIKIEVVPVNQQEPVQHFSVSKEGNVKALNPILEFWNAINPITNKWSLFYKN